MQEYVVLTKKICISPTLEQIEKINTIFNLERYLWNKYIEWNQRRYKEGKKFVSWIDFDKILRYLKKNYKEYEFLKTLCYLSKNVYNESMYNIRQHYFSEGTYLRYEANYHLMKNSENYKKLGGAIAQQTMRCADRAFKSFFGLLKLAKSGKYERGIYRRRTFHPGTGEVH